MTATLSRRAMLAGVALAPAAVALPTLAASHAAWDAALAAYRQADAIFTAAFDALSEAQQAFYDARPERPDLIVNVPYANKPGTFPFSYSEKMLREEHFCLGGPDWRAEKLAELDAYHARVEVLEVEHRLQDLEDAQFAAMDARTEAAMRLMRVPAPDLAALAVKLAITEDAGDDETEECFACLREDIRLLAGQEARHA